MFSYHDRTYDMFSDAPLMMRGSQEHVWYLQALTV